MDGNELREHARKLDRMTLNVGVPDTVIRMFNLRPEAVAFNARASFGSSEVRWAELGPGTGLLERWFIDRAREMGYDVASDVRVSLAPGLHGHDDIVQLSAMVTDKRPESKHNTSATTLVGAMETIGERVKVVEDSLDSAVDGLDDQIRWLNNRSVDEWFKLQTQIDELQHGMFMRDVWGVIAILLIGLLTVAT